MRGKDGSSDMANCDGRFYKWGEIMQLTAGLREIS